MSRRGFDEEAYEMCRDDGLSPLLPPTGLVDCDACGRDVTHVHPGEGAGVEGSFCDACCHRAPCAPEES